MNWKSTVVVSGAGLLATMFGWVATPTIQQRAPASPATAVRHASAPTTPVSDIQHEAARLQSRLVPEATFRQPSRNPFRFAARVTSRRAESTPVQETPAVVLPSVPARPNIRLRGIATDAVDGAVQRTAILTADAGLLLVREGEMAGTYRVTKIEDEAVELAGPEGSLRLTLSTSNFQLPTSK